MRLRKLFVERRREIARVRKELDKRTHKVNQARRLKELETENGRLKRLVADKELDIVILKEAAKGNW